MAVQITQFKRAGVGPGGAQLWYEPVRSTTTTFTTYEKGILRVYVTTTDATITINGITWTQPANTIEGYGVEGNTLVTVA